MFTHFYTAIQLYLSNRGTGENVWIRMRFRAAVAASDQCANEKAFH